jgi:hypothetical protein
MTKGKMQPVNKDAQLFVLEEHLAGTLKPITPPKELVTRLQNRIHLPEPQEIVSRLSNWKRLFLVYGGVMSGMLATITIARALFYFFGRKQI